MSTNKPSNQPNQQENNDTPTPKSTNIFHVLIVVFLITFGLNLLWGLFDQKSEIPVEYTQFIQLVDKGYVSKVELTDDVIAFTMDEKADVQAVGELLYPELSEGVTYPPFNPGTVFYTGRIEDANLVSYLLDHQVGFYKRPVTNRSSPLLDFITFWIAPTLLFYLIYYFLIKRLLKKVGGAGGAGGGMFSVGKSTAKEYNVEKRTGVTFKDVAGQDEAKESLSEMVDYLHNPEKYQKIGAKQPKGALLVGPPGTGKTLLAKAVAGEANVPFYSISGSEFIEMFVGVGASRVRDLFDNAKKNAPCIIFIDEIDAIGKSRDNQMGGNDEREQTLNQLLAEMDGFDTNNGIIVLAATNRPEVLDKALLRAGRFDRRVIVERPDLPGREAILKVHAAKVKMADNVNLTDIALATSGASGADLANMVNEGALLAVKHGRDEVRQEDLMEAVEVVIAGKEKKDRVMNQKERKTVAYHEVGHALVSALQKNSQPVQKITIVPRTMGSLGYTMNMPEEERYLMTRNEMLAQINTLLGGRAAEIIVFDEVTTGASNDIERATKLARSMVTQYGMSKQFGPMGLETTENKYLDGRNVSTASEQTGVMVDKEVHDILEECQQNAIELLENNRNALDAISMYLLEKENITGEEFMTLLKQAQEG